MSRIVTGDATGVAMPADVATLAESPEAYLTAAMHAYGSLGSDNEVLRVERLEEVTGGNSGQKALIDVIYARPDPDLPTRLFAKFSRDFTDPFRDRRRGELEGEVRLAALSRHPAFPVEVARPVFGDFEATSGTGLLVIERIAFGQGAIEPMHEKCRDHFLEAPLEYYRVLVSAQARLAAAQHRGALSPLREDLFPFDRGAVAADLPIGYDRLELRRKVNRLGQFIAAHPQLFPASLADPAFPARLEAEALAILDHEAAIRAFLSGDDRLLAVCHWNTNIDNAWFHREDDGSLGCGLLDWGMVRWMNAATGLWGGLSAADTSFLTRELDGLLAHYASELAAHGGPLIEASLLGRHFDLALAIAGLALMLDLPALLDARAPDIGRASGPHDALITRDKVVDGFLLVSTNFLVLWATRDFGASLAAVLEDCRTDG